MAKALCELQLDLQCTTGAVPVNRDHDGAKTSNSASQTDHFAPITPSGKETNRKTKSKRRPNPISRFQKTKERIEAETVVASVLSEVASTETDNASSYNSTDSRPLGDVEFFSRNRIGNFPSPREIAGLNERFLAKRCGLGYRASRILKLAQGIVEGRIQLGELEEACKEPSSLSYTELAELLNRINGFGPYTSANVLVCMGFYHVVPSDSETIRHLKQVHARESTAKTIQSDAGAVYEKYAPFQFLAYWYVYLHENADFGFMLMCLEAPIEGVVVRFLRLELWQFYEERFGKLCEMPHADYRLITASNMKLKEDVTRKRAKMSSR